MSVHLEVALVSVQDRCMVCAEIPREWKSFCEHPMVLLANGGQEEARFDPFGDSVNLVVR